MGKKQYAFEFTSEYDGLILHGIDVCPSEEAVRGVVVIIHGMVEHKERYLPFMEYLASIGFASLIYDQRGHGESIAAPEDLGYLYRKGEWGLREDACQALREAERRYPGLPVHLFGHSMGSLVVRNVLEKQDDQLASLTVSGMVAPNPVAGLGKAIASVIGLFRGERHRSAFMTNMAFGSYNKNIPDPVSANAWLNTDPEAVKAYDEDPLCGYRFTINGYKALMEMIRMCYAAGNYEKKNLDLPILFLSGGEDPCCGGKAGFDKGVAFLKDVGYTNVSGVMLPGMRHEILNEPERQKVYELVAAHLGRV